MILMLSTATLFDLWERRLMARKACTVEDGSRSFGGREAQIKRKKRSAVGEMKGIKFSEAA